MSQRFSSCPPHGDVTSCLEHPGSALLENGISWAPAQRLGGHPEGVLGPTLPSITHRDLCSGGLAAAWVVGSLPRPRVKTSSKGGRDMWGPWG